MTNLPIPDADPATKAEIIDWLERFFACVREVDFRSAYPFWHDDIVIFGTFQELVRSRQAWTDTQWSNVWPRTKDFTLDAKNTEVLLSGDGEPYAPRRAAAQTDGGGGWFKRLRGRGKPSHEKGAEEA